MKVNTDEEEQSETYCTSQTARQGGVKLLESMV